MNAGASMLSPRCGHLLLRAPSPRSVLLLRSLSSRSLLLRSLSLRSLLPLVVFGLLAGPASAETSEQILANHRKALGGDAALSKSSSTVFTGKTTHQGFSRTFTWSALAPTFLRADDTGKDYLEATATDGRHAWLRLPNGVVIGLQGAERDPIQLLSILLNRAYLTPEDIDLSAGEAVKGDAGQWTIPMTGRNIAPFELSFDAKTWQLVRATCKRPQGRLTLQLEDLRKESGLMLPMRIRSVLVDQGLTDETVYFVQKVDRKAELEESLFERPSEPSQNYKLPDGKTQVGVPVQYLQDNRHLLVQVSINGGDAAPFLLDSAAPMSLVDTALAAKLQLPVVEKMLTGDASSAELVPLHSVSKLSIGGLELTSTVVAAVDLSGLTKQLGRPLSGIVGMEAFDRLVVELKYADGAVTFYDPSAYTDTGKAEALPVDDYGRVNALINGQNLLTALLDTGSGAAISVAPGVAKQEKLEPAAKNRIPVAIAGVGATGAAWLGGLESVTLSQHRVPKVVAVFPEPAKNAAAGEEENTVVGNQLLERFNVTFDLPRRQVLLEQGPWFSRPTTYDRSGLFWKAGSEGVVESIVEGMLADIKPGDQVVAVMTDKGWSTDRKVIDATFAKDAGTKVKLRIKRARGEQEREIVLREILFPPTPSSTPP